ncbi:hypothetical protein [Acinetobacter sp. WCHAc060025]|uniref:hypothetical protein n=1 Tax=Acinetobacter sp. WCHAc060025 TaxID=2518625 RepID=UPI001022B104|nr:hypothetical protein [Acinetobacter sp. WCHAc060025]RZG74727.1 hypothetical protein EXE09_12095 [Acinetobacter sp. WCHAc060025]
MSEIDLVFRNKVHAILKLQVRNAFGDITKETEWFNNLVLDQGLNLMATGFWFNACQVGTGNSPPHRGQTGLDNLLATSTTVVSEANGAAAAAPYYKWTRKTFRFSAGTAAGNLSEVSVCGDNYPNKTSWNRALIKDNTGNPITVTVLPTETLDVIVEMRMHIDATDKIGDIDFGNGVVRQYTLRPMLISSMVASTIHNQGLGFNSPTGRYTLCYTGGISDTTGRPSGQIGTGDASSHSAHSYIQNSYRMACTSKFNPGVATGNIRSLSLEWPNACFYQLEFDSPITKTATHELSITTEISWDRYEPT